MTEFESPPELMPTPQEIVHSMLAPETNSVFVLGCFEKRITVYHQQVRALNLVYALHRLGYCNNVRIAVIGAGAAGMTAAAAFSLCAGCTVELFEREDRMLPVLDQGGSRFLSPYLYEWPGVKDSAEAHYRTPHSAPMTAWPEGTQSSVVQWLRKEWERYAKSVQVHLNVVGLSLSPQPSKGKPELSWFTLAEPGVRKSSTVDLVVLALGFGVESTMEPLSGNSYWKNDDILDLLSKDSSILISGGGDGGWTDLFRVALPGFRQDHLNDAYLKKDHVPRETIEYLVSLEERAKKEQALGRNPSEMLTQAYAEIKTPKLNGFLMAEHKRGPTPRVVLNASANYVSLDCFIANRFLGSRLIQAGIVEQWPGRITRITAASIRGKYSVLLDNGHVGTFNRVILRHGVKPALEQFDKTLFTKWEPALRKVALIDRTNIPAWPEEYFENTIRTAAEPLIAKPHRILTAEAIEKYRLAVRDQFRKSLSQPELLAAARPSLTFSGAAGVSNRPVTLEEIVSDGPVVFSYDEWDKSAVTAWLGAVADYAPSDPAVLGLTNRCIPLVLNHWNLDTLRKEKGTSSELFEIISVALREECGVEITPDRLKKWPAQTGFPWLLILYIEWSLEPDDGEILKWLFEQAKPKETFRIIVLQKSGARSIATLFPDVTSYEFHPAQSDPWEALTNGLSLDQRQSLRTAIKSLFAPGDITWSLVALARDAFISQPGVKCNSQTDFGALCHEYASACCAGSAKLAEKILPSIGYHSGIDRELAPRHRVIESVSQGSGVSRAEVTEVVDLLIGAKFLHEQWLSNPSQKHLAEDDPRLVMGDRFFRSYLAGKHLSDNPTILSTHLTEHIGMGRHNRSLFFALMLSEGKTDELIAPLLTDLNYQNAHFLVHALTRGVKFSAKNTKKILDALLESNNLHDKDFDLLAQLAPHHKKVFKTLRRLSDEGEPNQPWIQIAAAEALHEADPTPESCTRLVKFASDPDAPSQRRIQAIHALENVGKTEQAREAAMYLANAGAQPLSTRIKAAEEAADLGALAAVDVLTQFAMDRSNSEPDRESAVRALRRLGKRKEVIEACWDLFENGVTKSSYDFALSTLIATMVHLANKPRIISRLEQLAGTGAPEERWWAIEQLEILGAGEVTTDLSRKLANDVGTSADVRLLAARHVAKNPSHRKELLTIFTGIVTDEKLPPKIRIEAAKSLISSGPAGSKEVREVLKSIAWDDDTIAPDLRVEAASTWGAFESEDSAIAEVFRLSQKPDDNLKLSCGNALGDLKALAHARRALMDVVVNGKISEVKRQAMWSLGQQRQFDELLAACRSNEIPPEQWPEVSMIFLELWPDKGPIEHLFPSKPPSKPNDVAKEDSPVYG